jgi:hypothetical protein
MPWSKETAQDDAMKQYHRAMECLSFMNHFMYEAKQDRIAYAEWYDIAVKRKRQLDTAKQALRRIESLSKEASVVGSPLRIAKIAADTLAALSV